MAEQFHWVTVQGRREKRKGPRPIHVTTYVDWKPGRSSISHPRWGKVCRVVKEVNQLDIELAERAWLHLEEAVKRLSEKMAKWEQVIETAKRRHRGHAWRSMPEVGKAYHGLGIAKKKVRRMQRDMISIDGRIFHLRARNADSNQDLPSPQ